MKLTSDNVEKVFLDCLYREEEILGIPEGQPPEGAVLIKGIIINTGLHPERLKGHLEDIRSMLSELPDGFSHDKGGGMSFLAACNTKEGTQWTSFHEIIDLLFVLGVGTKLVRLCAPRELWGALPGGMPYYVLNLEGFPD